MSNSALFAFPGYGLKSSAIPGASAATAARKFVTVSAGVPPSVTCCAADLEAAIVHLYTHELGVPRGQLKHTAWSPMRAPGKARPPVQLTVWLSMYSKIPAPRSRVGTSLPTLALRNARPGT